jgi:two-component system, chemotaxis family, chemotaxis protein CheY
MSNLQKLRVMIVDDEPFMRSTIKAMLRVVGRCIVTEADDGETALALLATAKPEVVLCDISMAPMNGLQFVERLRNHPNPATRDIAVVMQTVHADEATIQSAAHLRINGYLLKPMSPKRLGDRLHAIFRDRPPPEDGARAA